MIVIDSSAFLAILAKEPESTAFIAAIADVERRMVSAVTVLETRMVMHGRYGAAGVEDFDQLLEDIEAQIVPFDADLAAAAFAAFTAWGKGIHARARLNLGDCVAYSLAKNLNVPLLFKGDDFRATDIVPAV